MSSSWSSTSKRSIRDFRNRSRKKEDGGKDQIVGLLLIITTVSVGLMVGRNRFDVGLDNFSELVEFLRCVSH